jgi:hypothetical protein
VLDERSCAGIALAACRSESTSAASSWRRGCRVGYSLRRVAL